MKSIREIIIVEGKYDKNTISQIIDATIIETSGFGIFSDKDKIALLRKLAEKRGLIILTDSDSAGFFIRGKLCGLLADADIRHAYIPDVTGYEKRKNAPSKEGKLGVEGMPPDILINALKQAGATFFDESDEPCLEKLNNPILKSDMYNAGLSGCKDSAQKRRNLAKSLDLPARLSSNALLNVLNALYTREEFLLLTPKS